MLNFTIDCVFKSAENSDIFIAKNTRNINMTFEIKMQYF